MGLFGFGKKKEESRNSTFIKSSADSAMNEELYKKLVSNSAVLLTKMHVTSEPFILTLLDDSGIFEGTFRNHITNPGVLALKSMSPDVYIKVCGMHMLGSGMYVCFMQEKLKKSVEDFSLEEIKSIAKAWENTDAYELALNVFGIPQQSQQKASLDQIYVYGLGVYKLSVNKAWDKKENLRAYMKAMYEAGFTVAVSELAEKGRG